jgi:hypothetical protein
MAEDHVGRTRHNGANRHLLVVGGEDQDHGLDTSGFGEASSHS